MAMLLVNGFSIFRFLTSILFTERLDQDMSGILTTICNHSFHCSCISNWTDSSCPVSVLLSGCNSLSMYMCFSGVVCHCVWMWTLHRAILVESWFSYHVLFRFVDIASNSLKNRFVQFAKLLRIFGCALSVGLLAVGGNKFSIVRLIFLFRDFSAEFYSLYVLSS